MYLKIESDINIKSINIVFNDDGKTVSVDTKNESLGIDIGSVKDSMGDLVSNNKNNLLERLAGLTNIDSETPNTNVLQQVIPDREPLVDTDFASKTF